MIENVLTRSLCSALDFDELPQPFPSHKASATFCCEESTRRFNSYQYPAHAVLTDRVPSTWNKKLAGIRISEDNKDIRFKTV